ncbi:MAG: hypothetical protein IPJ39_19695 [Saprospiraceae bacterium]|nr:hypothetical protein [Saprospiraceae bacterium]
MIVKIQVHQQEVLSHFDYTQRSTTCRYIAKCIVSSAPQAVNAPVVIGVTVPFIPQNPVSPLV